MKVWKFHSSKHKFSQKYQKAPLRIIFNIKKKDLRRKAKLVVGEHKLDSSHLETYLSVIQLLSVCILLTVAAKNNLKVVSGDVGNAFLHAKPLEKVYTIAGSEFREREGCLVEIIRNMYGMASASRAFSLHLGDFIQSLGFEPTRANPDIWIKSEEDGKSY